MNIKIVSQILRIKKGQVVNDSNGVVTPYAQIFVVEKNIDEEDDFGIKITKISLDPSLYDQAKQFCKSRKVCDIDVDVISTSDGKFKLKATSIKEGKNNNLPDHS